MDLSTFIYNIYVRLFYGSSTYQTKAISRSTQLKAIPTQVVTNIHVCQSSFAGQSLQSRVSQSAPASANPLVPPLVSFPAANQGFIPVSTVIQDSLGQNLQSQIHQLEKEGAKILAEIAIKRSERTSSTCIHSVSSLVCNQNVEKQADLNQLNHEVTAVKRFCDQEMIQILDLLMESDKGLNQKLEALRAETAFIEDETQLGENIERISILEKAIDSLHQLEAKFQDTQRTNQHVKKPSSSKQEQSINTLLEQMDRLHQQNQFLEESKDHLPAGAFYDSDELKDLMQLFENESEELSQQTRESRHQLNQAEQVARELVNHLLDYTEIFKDYFQKLEGLVQDQASIVKPSLAIPLKRVPIRSITTYNRLAPAAVFQKTTKQIHSLNEEKFDPNALKAAAVEVNTALKELLELMPIS